MSIKTIPQEFRDGSKVIRQVNRGDLAGELWASQNIDLVTSPGKIKVSKRLKRVLNNSFLGGFDIVGITIHDGRYYVLTTDTLWQCSTSDDPTVVSNWTENTLASTNIWSLGFYSDIQSYAGALLVTTDNNITRIVPDSSLSNTWWTTNGGTAFTSTKQHIMHVHRSGTETLFVSDGNLIRYYNAAAGHTTITLDTLTTAHCFASGQEAVWVGTYNEVADCAYVYEVYVGETISAGVAVPRNAYRVDGRAVLSIEVINNTPYIVTERGVIQKFNGASFETVAYFPFAYKQANLDGVLPGLIQDTPISRPVHPKGMKAFNDTLYILFNTKTNESTAKPADERAPSGVWQYDVATGTLNHRYALTNEATDYAVGTLTRTSPILVSDEVYTSILVGGEVEDGTNTGIGLWTEGDETQSGYFITTENDSANIQDTFEKVTLKANTPDSGENIVVKYRTTKEPDYPFYDTITWLDTNRFTTTNPSYSSVAEGDEVEILRGHYSGLTMHITDIDEGSSTFTVTVDEPLGALNETSFVRLQNWQKLPKEYTSEAGEYLSIGVNKSCPWIQYKVVMTGNIELRQFISKGNSKTDV